LLIILYRIAMNHYKRLLVGLDFSNSDKGVIRYLSYLCSLIQPRKIQFIYFLRKPDLPDKLMGKFAGIPDPARLRAQMIESVQKNFPGYEKYKMEYSVIEGVPMTEMLKWVHTQKTDLIVMGKKRPEEGSGLLAQKYFCSARLLRQFTPCPRRGMETCAKH
jgi:hypothetical protein